MFGGDPDEHIYRALCAGNTGAIRRLVRKYGSSLLRFIHSCLGAGRLEDIEEVCNDALLAVWHDVAEYDPRRARFKNWVFFKARCAALDRRRKLAREARAGEPLPLLEGAEVSWHVILQVDLALALGELCALDRQIVYLCDYLDWNHRQVAERLCLKPGTLDSRLQRARKRLGRILESWRPRRVLEDGGGRS